MTAAEVVEIHRRSEREQTANTVVLLVFAGLIPSTVSMRKLAEAVGLEVRDLTLAKVRFGNDENLRPRERARLEPVGSEVAAPADWTPQPSGRYGRPGRPPPRNVAAKNPTAGQRRCSTCKALKPVTAFDKKGRTGNTLKSACRACVKAYQRDRYLTVRKARAVDSAVAYFTTIEGDGVIGMACPDCLLEIQPGQRVSLEARPHHAGCGTAERLRGGE